MANGGRAGYMGRPKYFTIYYRSTRSTRSLQENMRICQGNLREFSGTNCPTFIAMNQLAVKITRRSLSFGCICINSSTCRFKQLFPWLCASFRIWSREMAYIDDNQNKEFAFVSAGLKSLKRVYKLTSKACLLTVASCILGQIEQVKDNTILVRGNHEK